MLKEFSFDNNDIFLVEFSDRIDVCICVLIKFENIEVDVKVVVCKINELNDWNLWDSRSSF